MDGLIALAILALLAFPALAIAAFVMVLGARGRIAALEQRLLYLEAGRPAAAAEASAAPVSPAPIEAAPLRDDTVSAVAGPEDAAVAPAEPPPPPPLPEDVSQPPPIPVAARPRESLEQRLGTRWAVWVGGLALALGAIFLVRYSIDAGWLGPQVRIAAAALFSLALLAGGEWLRRNERAFAVPVIPAANIPSIVTAAGTVGLFATVYGAYALYGLIGPTAAFVLMAAIGLGTMAAAALHGPWLSGLGLVGAYAAPLLVSTACREDS